MIPDGVGVDRFAVRGEAHEFVFAAVDPEPAEIRERGVEHPQRMGEVDLLDQFGFIIVTRAD